MDLEIWIALIVPALAVVAAVDSAVGFSAGLSHKLGLRNALWMHITMLFASWLTFLVSLNYAFPEQTMFAIVHYVYLEEHWFGAFVAPRIILTEILLIIPVSMMAALLISIGRRRTMRPSIFLSVVAAKLGNIGTIVWLLGARYREIVVWRRIDDGMAARINCLEDMVLQKFLVQGADFFAVPLETKAANRAEHGKWFDSIEEAVAVREEDFRALRRAV
jgi:hypothetical protein